MGSRPSAGSSPPNWSSPIAGAGCLSRSRSCPFADRCLHRLQRSTPKDTHLGWTAHSIASEGDEQVLHRLERYSVQRQERVALDVDVVFGQSSVVLPAQGVYAARLAGVFGQTTVLIPAGLEASVRIEPLLAARTIDSDLRQLPDGRYATAGYGQSENQVDLVVSQVIGAIEIEAE